MTFRVGSTHNLLGFLWEQGLFLLLWLSQWEVCFLETSRKWCGAWELTGDREQNPPKDVQGIGSHRRPRGS